MAPLPPMHLAALAGLTLRAGLAALLSHQHHVAPWRHRGASATVTTSVVVEGVPCVSAAMSTPGGVMVSSITNAIRAIICQITCPNGSMSTAKMTSTYGHGTPTGLSQPAGPMTMGVLLGMS
eukprot:1375091-Pyramimonas_sp.AAC.1